MQTNPPRRFVRLFISAVCLVISNYYHPSVVIVLCAFGAYLFIHELEKCICHPKLFIQELIHEIKSFKGTFVSVTFLLVSYLCIWTATMTIIKNSGYIQNTTTISFLCKLPVGFNFETGGTYSKEDYAYILSYPIDEQSLKSIRLVQARIKENGITNTIQLLLHKNQQTWWGIDNYFGFYQAGTQKELTEKINNIDNPVLKKEYERELETFKYFVTDISIANTLFTYFIWFLALIGIVTVLQKYNSGHYLYMLMYIPLGWMLFIMISEMQPRYRYQGMTIIILLAGLGAKTLKDWFAKIQRRLLN